MLKNSILLIFSEKTMVKEILRNILHKEKNKC